MSSEMSGRREVGRRTWLPGPLYIGAVAVAGLAAVGHALATVPAADVLALEVFCVAAVLAEGARVGGPGRAVALSLPLAVTSTAPRSLGPPAPVVVPPSSGAGAGGPCSAHAPAKNTL